MKLYKAALLSSLIGCATLGQAVAETPAYAAKNSTITMSLTPTEEVGEDEHEETQENASFGQDVLYFQAVKVLKTKDFLDF